MYIRKIKRQKDGKTHAYWALVESYRTERGPRQRTVAYLGEMDSAGRIGVKVAAEGSKGYQQNLSEPVEPRWVEVNLQGIRTERIREFGAVWLGLELFKRLGLDKFFKEVLPEGREEIPWADMVLILLLARFCHPSSELYIAEHFYGQSALSDLLGVSPDKVNDDRLYRALDQLLPYKEALESHLKERMGGLFGNQYDLLLYDLTSTYFEGQAEKNDQAQRGYSRDKRPDCKQVCIGLVVTREGIPLGYEIFDGNTQDATTLKEIVATMESRYGVADRIWVLDRGLVNNKNMAFLRKPPRKYIVGTPKSMLKQFEKELVSDNWQTIRAGIEVQCCCSPDGEEVFILCRSADRKVKERAIHERFIKNIEDGLEKLKNNCANGRFNDPGVVERKIGRVLGRNSRASRFFKVQVKKTTANKLELTWTKHKDHLNWAQLTEGCYLLRSNIKDWTPEDLWFAYVQLSQAEAAFRIQKSDLRLRPIWHQKQERVQAHILVCFLAYVIWQCLSQSCEKNGLGNEPRKVLDEIGRLQLSDVVLPTRDGTEIKLRCVSKPDAHQRILLQHLGLHPPARLTKNTKCSEDPT